MKKIVKTMVGLLFTIALVLALVGCPIEVYDGPEADVDDLLGTWKNSTVSTKNGKTVTEDTYMTFTFDYFTKSTVIKTGQEDEIKFFPAPMEEITQWTSTALNIIPNIQEKGPLTIIFSDGEKKDFYIKGNTSEKYTKFDGEIPQHDLRGSWKTDEINFSESSIAKGYYTWGFGELFFLRSRTVTESNDTEHTKGFRLLSSIPFSSVTQKGDTVKIEDETLTASAYKTITINKSKTPYSFIDDNVTYTKE